MLDFLLDMLDQLSYQEVLGPLLIHGSGELRIKAQNLLMKHLLGLSNINFDFFLNFLLIVKMLNTPFHQLKNIFMAINIVDKNIVD